MRVALDVDFFVFSLFISPGGAGALVATDLLVPGSSWCQLLRVLKQWPMKGSEVPSHSFLFSWWRGRAGGDGTLLCLEALGVKLLVFSNIG